MMDRATSATRRGGRDRCRAGVRPRRHTRTTRRPCAHWSAHIDLRGHQRTLVTSGVRPDPTTAAAIRVLAARTNTSDRLDHAIERSQPVGLGLLAIAIAAIFATHARVVTDNPDAFFRLLAPLAAFFAVTYFIATVTARALELRHPERVTLTAAR